MFGSHEATLLRDKQSLLRDEQSLLRDEQSLLRDKQRLLRGKPTFLSYEEALLRRGNTHKHQPLNKRTHHGHKIHSSSSDFHEPKRSPIEQIAGVVITCMTGNKN